MADDRRAMIERILAAKAGTLKADPVSAMRHDDADRRAYGLMGFETDTPSGYAGFRGYEIDPLSLPVGADPASDKEFSQDDGGRPVYKTRWGDSYQISPTAQPGGSRVKAAYGAFKNDPIGVAGQIAKAIGGAAWAGFSAPGRAAAGEPVTYGDAIETIGLVGGGGGAFSAPKGSLRSGGLRTLYHGTSDDAAEMIAESGRINGPAYFTPDYNTAQNYADGGRVLSVDIPESSLMIDLDLPGGLLLDVEGAANYLGEAGWTLDDFIRRGYSVGVQDGVPFK